MFADYYVIKNLQNLLDTSSKLLVQLSFEHLIIGRFDFGIFTIIETFISPYMN